MINTSHFGSAVSDILMYSNKMDTITDPNLSNMKINGIAVNL